MITSNRQRTFRKHGYQMRKWKDSTTWQQSDSKCQQVNHGEKNSQRPVSHPCNQHRQASWKVLVLTFKKWYCRKLVPSNLIRIPIVWLVGQHLYFQIVWSNWKQITSARGTSPTVITNNNMFYTMTRWVIHPFTKTKEEPSLCPWVYKEDADVGSYSRTQEKKAREK